MLRIQWIEIQWKVTFSQTHYFPLKSTKYGVQMPKHQQKDPTAYFPIPYSVCSTAHFQIYELWVTSTVRYPIPYSNFAIPIPTFLFLFQLCYSYSNFAIPIPTFLFLFLLSYSYSNFAIPYSLL